MIHIQALWPETTLAISVGRYQTVCSQLICSQLCQLAGLADLSEQRVKRFEQQAGSAALQLKQAAQGGNQAQFQDAVQQAQRYDHLSGPVVDKLIGLLPSWSLPHRFTHRLAIQPGARLYLTQHSQSCSDTLSKQ